MGRKSIIPPEKAEQINSLYFGQDTPLPIPEIAKQVEIDYPKVYAHIRRELSKRGFQNQREYYQHEYDWAKHRQLQSNNPTNATRDTTTKYKKGENSYLVKVLQQMAKLPRTPDGEYDMREIRALEEALEYFDNAFLDDDFD